MADVPEELDCAVCLQNCQHPTKLPCGHIFCFLCVKGVTYQSRRCAMCRAIIPVDYLDNPIILNTPSHPTIVENAPECYQWYYEGRNGWWRYDERSNLELETAYNAEQSQCTLLLAGALYVVDFEAMTQFRRSNQIRKRKVRRDSPSLPAKGIAGIKIKATKKKEPNSKTEQNPNNVANVDGGVTENDNVNVNDDQGDRSEYTSDRHQHESNLHELESVSNVVGRFSVINLRYQGLEDA